MRDKASCSFERLQDSGGIFLSFAARSELRFHSSGKTSPISSGRDFSPSYKSDRKRPVCDRCSRFPLFEKKNAGELSVASDAQSFKHSNANGGCG